MMETAIAAIIAKLDASSLVLVIVLVGGWKLLREGLKSFQSHSDKVGGSLEKIADDCHELRKDMSAIAKQVATHEVRIDYIETTNKDRD